LEVLTLVDPASEPGVLAASMLRSGKRLSTGLPTGLDVTGSVDAALALLDRVVPGSEWNIFYNRFISGRTGPLVDARGPYSVHIIVSDRFLYIGQGWTPATCLLDGILQTKQPPESSALPLNESLEAAQFGWSEDR
jgi:hypothetical protein